MRWGVSHGEEKNIFRPSLRHARETPQLQEMEKQVLAVRDV